MEKIIAFGCSGVSSFLEIVWESQLRYTDRKWYIWSPGGWVYKPEKNMRLEVSSAFVPLLLDYLVHPDRISSKKDVEKLIRMFNNGRGSKEVLSMMRYSFSVEPETDDVAATAGKRSHSLLIDGDVAKRARMVHKNKK
jgi:DNA mismatch repair ATPase MutS